MEKRKPERTCIACREKKDKMSMIRIVKTHDGSIDIDISHKLEGRGCYVCPKEKCLVALKKNRALSRTYKENVGEEVYDRIITAAQQLRKD